MASSSFASTAPFTSSEPQPRHSFPLPCCSATAQSQTAELAPPNSPKCLNNFSSTCQRQQQQQQRVPMPAGNRIATFGPPAGGNSSSNIGNQRRLLKSRAQSDLVPLMKAGLRLSRQDPGIRRLMAQQGNSNGSSSSKQSASPAASSTFLTGKKLSGLGPIQEQATFDEGVDPLQLLPDLQGDLLEMRSRSGTVDSAGSSARRRRARGVSVSESEIIRVLAGGCDNCHSLLLIHNATSKPRVSNITFSTVTSATGLPTIAAEPSRPRSSSYWKPTASAAAATHSQQQQSNVGTGQSSSSVTSASASSTSHEQNKEQPTVENYNNTEHRPTVDANNFERGQSSTAGTLRSADQQVTGSNTTGAKVVAAAVEGAPPLSDKVVGGGAIRPQQKVHDIQATVAARIEAAGSNNDGTKSHRMTGQSRSGFFTTNVAGGIADAQPKPTVVPSSLPQQQQQQSTVLANDQQQSTNVPSASSAHRPTSNNKKAAATPAAPMLLEEECCSSEHSSSSSSSTGADHSLAPAVYKTVDGTHFDREELERDPALRQIQEWSFPIFRFADKHKTTVLSRLTYAIFKEAHLFRTFKISHAKFFNYFHALESGYWDIPYHNRIHAADVLHGCYYLTCHPVHAFGGYHSEMDDEEEDEDEEEAGAHSDHCDEHCADDESTTHQHQNHAEMSAAAALPLAQSMSALELMALYTAAAMHDYDHPGRTNAFLVASEDRKAILYNDRSVLENHHAAESWRLLTSQTQNHFIENLDSAETKRFRYLVLEYILATDLKQHFDIIMQFNERAPEMDLSSESDRVLVSLMLIKFADINSPAKPYQLHRQWTERICQEFYEQGDEEKVRHMAISPYMDRQEPAVSKLQDSFIAHIVNPLAVALNEAGLLPVLPGLPESELIINLKHNHQKWLQQIEVDQQQQQQQKVDRKKEIDGQQQQQRLAIEQKKNREENNESSTQQPPLEENNNKINGEGSPPRVPQSNNLPTKAHTNAVTNSHHQQPRKGSSPRLGSGRTAMATSDSRQTMPNRTNGGKVVTGSPVVRMAKKEQPMTATTKATPTTCMTTVSPSSVTSPSSSSKVTSNNCNRGSTPTSSASATAADRRSPPNSRRIDTSSTSLATTTAMPSPSPTSVVSASAKTTR